ncbi:hypothetical protein K0M31_014582 [Melipona bicolor]|uniref:Uncharacterized protein n=1 Tax=Melipona bicolor TaxID=60889 RepID=A0AA40KUI0_9HYME|nr:hypothetical protein K0M31_014582 [Melipona bicolor]
MVSRFIDARFVKFDEEGRDESDPGCRDVGMANERPRYSSGKDQGHVGIGAPSFIATVNNDAETRTSVSPWRALTVYYGLETNLRSENCVELSPMVLSRESAIKDAEAYAKLLANARGSETIGRARV